MKSCAFSLQRFAAIAFATAFLGATSCGPRSAVDACVDLDDRLRDAGSLWSASRFHDASLAFERLAKEIEGCRRLGEPSDAAIEESTAADLLHAGEAAHQARETGRAGAFVGDAIGRLRHLQGRTKTADATFSLEVFVDLKEAYADRAGVWTEQGRLF